MIRRQSWHSHTVPCKTFSSDVGLHIWLFVGKPLTRSKTSFLDFVKSNVVRQNYQFYIISTFLVTLLKLNKIWHFLGSSSYRIEHFPSFLGLFYVKFLCVSFRISNCIRTRVVIQVELVCWLYKRSFCVLVGDYFQFYKISLLFREIFSSYL